MLALCAGLVLGGGCAPGSAVWPPAPFEPVRLDVIWVASDLRVVMRMLELAEVGPGDVVYDLGSGDGRIVIAAAQRFGARGVGIELDPVLVHESRRLALRAGVSDRVSFRQQDLFDAELGEATVVTLYLSPEVNLRLRPKLLRELRPGSRVVSHEHDMGDWLPDKTVLVPIVERQHRVFLWRIAPSRP